MSLLDDKPSWQVLEELFPKLKPAQRALAQSFVEQARRNEAGRVPLAELLQSHFGDTTQRASTGLRQTKKRLNEELTALGAGIELAVDESGKLETRACYLQAPADKKKWRSRRACGCP
ncbi:hypothetical protein E4P82_16995 [Candidatus Competibacter phosphatis]|uniref:NACHT N-terminal Helical domain-containing protein n=1 Tax=Candidatus Competibacter phosphatis TaxID=221280 RepID=A0ABX1TMV4_9GAMM|nr:hypothetical protein [Candidatus Competibacter phosphatis]NMQ20740.1 hypothetical protein [Candidatus Competibacter phosphatis]